MAQIFISYSHSDRPYLDKLLPLIRKVYGHDSVWFDDDIHGGMDWRQTILDEIDKCNLFIYLVSNESLTSPYCQEELRHAHRSKKNILPVIVRRLNPPYPGNISEELEPILTNTQYIDLIDADKPDKISSLYAAMNRLIDRPAQQPSIPKGEATAPPASVPANKPVSRFNPTEGQAIVIAAILALIGTIAAALIALSANNQQSGQNDTVTNTPPSQAAIAPSQTVPDAAATATPTLSPEPTSTEVITANVPTETLDSQPTTPAPTSTTRSDDGSAALSLLIDSDSFTLYVPDRTDLTGLSFAVQADGNIRDYSLETSFSALRFTEGIASSKTCYVYVLTNTQPVLAQNCTGQTFRIEVAPADRFWYDSTQNRFRDIAIYHSGNPTGTICPGGQPECSFDW